MKNLALILGVAVVGFTACNKDEVEEPTPSPDPIEYPIPDGPLEEFPIVSPDEAMIVNYEEMDGALFCPTEVLNLEVSATMPIIKVKYRGFYVSGVTGDSTLMWEKESVGDNPVELEYYDFAEAEIDAVVYGEYDTIQTLGFKPLGYDFQLPVVAHMEHPLLYSGNNFETPLELSGPNYASYQWTKDWENIDGANERIHIATEPGFYDIQTTPNECPDYVLRAGANVEVVRVNDADMIDPIVQVDGNKISVVNLQDHLYATYSLEDAAGNFIFDINAVYSGEFEDLAAGTYQVVVSFWGNDWYMGLGEIARVSEANTRVTAVVH